MLVCLVLFPWCLRLIVKLEEVARLQEMEFVSVRNVKASDWHWQALPLSNDSYANTPLTRLTKISDNAQMTTPMCKNTGTQRTFCAKKTLIPTLIPSPGETLLQSRKLSATLEHFHRNFYKMPRWTYESWEQLYIPINTTLFSARTKCSNQKQNKKKERILAFQ